MRAAAPHGTCERQRLHIPSRMELSRRPLASARLLIEPISSAHHQAFFRAVDDARAVLEPWLPWVPLNDTADASLRYTNACERDWDKGAAVRFFVRVRNQPGVAGVVSLENCVQTHQSCELGYWLHPHFHRQGLMTEAASRVLEFAFQEMGAHRVRAAAAFENLASQRVIERLHFTREGVARDAEFVNGRWISHLVYSRLSSDRATSP